MRSLLLLNAMLIAFGLYACKADDGVSAGGKKSKNDLDAGGTNAWSSQQIEQAQKQCITDFTVGEAAAKPEQIASFCSCLIDNAKARYTFEEYYNDVSTFRDRQAKQGHLDSCRQQSNLPPLEIGRKWDKALLFDSGSNNKTNPISIMGPDDNPIVIFGRRANADIYTLYMRRFDGTKWLDAQKISENMNMDPEVAINKKGQMVLVWAYTYNDLGTMRSNIYASLYDPQTGWSAPLEVNSRGGALQTYSAIIDDNGNAVVAWNEIYPHPTIANTSYSYSFLRKYHVGSGWKATEMLGDYNFFEPRLAFAPGGVIHVLIARYNESTGSAEVGTMVGSLNGGFSAISMLEQFEANSRQSFNLQVASDDAGNLTAAWLRADRIVEESRIVTAYNLASKKTWVVQRDFSNNTKGRVFSLKLRMNAKGKAVAVWTQYEVTRQLIWATHFDPGTLWLTPKPIDRNAGTQSHLAAVSVNEKGDAIAAWMKQTEKNKDSWAMWSTIYNGFFWQKEEQISSDVYGKKAFIPSVVIRKDGSGFAFWQQGNGDPNAPEGTDSIQYAEYK